MSAPTPVRGLGTFDASMVVVGSIVGAGAFFVSGEVARTVSSPGAFFALWAAGGLLALCGALCNGELGALFPRGGGEYVYLREAYGPALGFLSGWTSFWVGFPGSIATIAAAFGEAVTDLAGGPPEATTAVAIGAVVALTAVNAAGLRPGKWTQNLLSLTKLLAFGALIAIGALAGRGDVAHFTPVLAEESPADLAVALVPILFAYSGWNAATYIAGEIRDPGRALGRALATGTLACVALYLALNAVYVYAMPLAEMRGVVDVAFAAATRLFGPGMSAALAVLVAVVMLSSLQAAVLTGPRITQAMAEDRLFFPPLARLHPRFRVPVTALVVQGALSSVLLLSGEFRELLRFTTVAIVAFSTLTVVALMVLRVRRPALARPFRTPGYPWTPILFIAGNLWVLGNVLATGAIDALVGLGIVACGVPVYLWYGRRSG